MYDKLERLRDIICDLEIDDKDRLNMINIIDDLERELDIQEDTIRYLGDDDDMNDEDDY